MVPDDITSLRATCLQVALQEAQQGALRTSIGARAAELATWAMDPNSPGQPPPLERSGRDVAAMSEVAEQGASGERFRQIRVDRAYRFEVPGREAWWLFRAGLGQSKASGLMPDFRSGSRLVGIGRMAVLVEIALSKGERCPIFPH